MIQQCENSSSRLDASPRLRRSPIEPLSHETHAPAKPVAPTKPTVEKPAEPAKPVAPAKPTVEKPAEPAKPAVAAQTEADKILAQRLKELELERQKNAILVEDFVGHARAAAKRFDHEEAADWAAKALDIDHDNAAAAQIHPMHHQLFVEPVDHACAGARQKTCAQAIGCRA